MAEGTGYGLVIGLVALAVFVAVLSNRLTEWIRVPAPALFLVAAAGLAWAVPALNRLSVVTVQRVVTVALIIILFDGGMSLGWRRFRAAAVPITLLGVVGTVLTTAAIALVAGTVVSWPAAVLLGAALAPTDPAVVFSVLGRREIAGRSGAILEGESGVNDPVGIAVMISLLAATGVAGGVGEFATEMVVGAAVGLVGGWALLTFIRRVSLPSVGLYPVRLLAGADLLYGVATMAHGSGFLAVFIAGILLGDADGPYQGESKLFLSALAHLGEIVAFVMLGLTVTLRSLPYGHAWEIGLLLAVVLTVVIRPLVVGVLLLPARLRTGEKAFIAWCGLKGAVPILLGTFLLTSGVEDAGRLYLVIVVVVTFSVIVQGGLVPVVARWCRVPMRLRGPGYSPDEESDAEES